MIYGDFMTLARQILFFVKCDSEHRKEDELIRKAQDDHKRVPRERLMAFLYTVQEMAKESKAWPLGFLQ